MINVAADSKVFLDRPSLQVCKQIVILKYRAIHLWTTAFLSQKITQLGEG